MYDLQIKIKSHQRVEVYTPYNKDFIDGIKQIDGAFWNRKKHCWCISGDQVAAVRELMRAAYGEDDLSANYENTSVLQSEKEFLEDRLAEVNGLLFMRAIITREETTADEEEQGEERHDAQGTGPDSGGGGGGRHADRVRGRG